MDGHARDDANARGCSPASKDFPTASIEAFLRLYPHLLEEYHLLNREAEPDILASAEKLKKLAAANPDAFKLHLQELSTQRQRKLSSLASRLSALRTDPDIPESQLEIVDTFQEILTEANDQELTEGNETLGKYADFMSALSSLMVQINGLVTQAKDKPKLRIGDMLEAMQGFREKYADDAGVLKKFGSEEDAKAFAERFRGGTVAIVSLPPNSGGEKYAVRFNTLAIEPVIQALCDNKSNADAIMRKLEAGEKFSAKDIYDLTRHEITTEATVQGLSLATSDVQKVFQTDLDLQISGIGRSISQFDNLMKLFSSMLSSLTDLAKAFLG